MFSHKVLSLLCFLAATAVTAASSPLDTLAQLPECAQPCIIDAVINSPCEAIDQACICANDALQAEATACVMQSCSVRESLLTKNSTLSSCDVAPRDETVGYIIMTYILAALIGISVFQRIAAKLWWKLRIELDDWCILLTTLVFTIPSLVINIHVLIANGMGRDIWTVPFDQITNFGNGFHAMAVLYFVQSMLIKLTLLIFYLRIFSTTDARKLLQGTLCFNVIFGIVFIMVAIFQCLPVGYLANRWDGEHQGSCIDINRFTWSHAAISIALDIWMLIIPLLQIKSLKLDWKKKVGATMMFCVGTTFTIVSVLRLQVLVQFGDSENATWDYTEICRWSTIETAVGIICVCMPSYRLLLTRLFPSVFNTAARSYAHPSHGGQSIARSRPIHDGLGSFTATEVAGPYEQIDSKGITCTFTYNVELGTHPVNSGGGSYDRTDNH